MEMISRRGLSINRGGMSDFVTIMLRNVILTKGNRTCPKTTLSQQDLKGFMS
jgi:hypothetical protein